MLDDFKQFLPDTSNQNYQQQTQTQVQEGYYVNNGTQLPPVGNFQQGGTGASPAYAQQQIPPQQHQQPQQPQQQPQQQQQQQQPQQVVYPAGASAEAVYAVQSNEQYPQRKKSVSEAYQDGYNQEGQYSNIRSGVAVQKVARARTKYRLLLHQLILLWFQVFLNQFHHQVLSRILHFQKKLIL